MSGKHSAPKGRRIGKKAAVVAAIGTAAAATSSMSVAYAAPSGHTLSVPRIAINEDTMTATVKAAPTPDKCADYIVKRGDTVSGVAAMYGVPLADLEALNPGIIKGDRPDDYSLIFAGGHIHLPDGSCDPVSPPPVTPPPPPTTPKHCKGGTWHHHQNWHRWHHQPSHVVPKPPSAPPAATTYTVVRGDTLSGIAATLGVPGGWESLYAVNVKVVGSNPNLIQPGMVLTVPTKDESGSMPPVTPEQPPASSGSGVSKGSDGLYIPVIAPDGPGEPSGYAAHSPSFWIPLIQQAEQIVPLLGGDQTQSVVTRILLESSGDPNAINNWDSNAANGDPSRGLMQTIGATFNGYHVAGTSTNIYNPLANITAALNYINHVYGGIVPLGSTY